MLRLIIGNKNYSSWSFRPWLAMKVAGIAFAETLISLEAADFKSRLLALSSRQGAGSDRRRRTHLGIASDPRISGRKIPAAGLWPQDPAARAHARAVASEMHAGFRALRRLLPMNVSRSPMPRALDADARTDVARIEAIWSECRARFDAGGPFLYGAFSAADAMYAPVVWRFHTYTVEVNAVARAYMRTLSTAGVARMAPPVQSGRQQEYVLPRRGHDFLPPFAGGCFN